MKPYCVRWQCSPLSDTRSPHENPTTIMPGVNRSDSDLTHSQSHSSSMPGKMLAPSLLRLNSVGEVSAESFPERATRKSKLGFSKSLDFISPAKSFSNSTGTHRNNTMRSASFWEPTFHPGRNDHFSSPPGFTAYHRNMPIVWQQTSFQSGAPHWKQNSSLNFTDYHNCKSLPKYNSTMNYPYPHRIPGLLPGAMYTAMSAFPNHAKKMPQSQSQNFEKGLSGQAFTPPNAGLSYFPAKSLNVSQALPTFSNMAAGPAVKTTSADFASDMNSGSDQNCIVSSRNVEKYDNFKKAQTDSVEMGSRGEVEKCVDVQACDRELTGNGKKCVAQTGNSLKRRNEKVSEFPGSASTSLNCSLSRVINDLSSVLSLRKTPKKGRPSCKKRKKRQHQRTSFTSQSQMNNCENVNSVTSPNQSQCISPIKIPSSASSSSPSPMKTSISPLSSSPSSSHPPPVTSLFCRPDSDSEWSDNEDIDDCDSLKWSCDFPKSLSPISDLGSALSFDTLFKPNNLPCLDKLLKSDNKCDSEPDPKSESPSSSSGSKKSLCFSLSFSVSEDEDSDKSFEFESLTASPSEQLILDFEFGNGLSLEAIIGKKADHFSCSSKGQLTDSEVSQSEHDVLLMNINAEWNKNYPAAIGTTSSTDKGKVQFAREEDLVQIHIVGNEERRGTWCEDGQRFLRRIQDVGKVISYVFSDKHRQDMRQKLGLS